MSLVLGDFGRNIGEVTTVTIPFERLDLFASPRHGTSLHKNDAIALVKTYEEAGTTNCRQAKKFTCN